MSLEVANGREQMLVMADRIANLRSMWHDGLTAGAELWERFNAPKEMIAWYYSKTIDGLGELEDVCETAPLYQEMNTLFKDLFVTFLIDEKNEILYQIADDPTSPIFVLTKKNPNWFPLQEDISEEAEQVSRKYAERMEENWLDILQKTLEKDIQGGDYQIYTGSGRNLAVSIANGCMTFMGYDYDETGEKPDYEYYYNLDEEDTGYILFSLRVEYGTTMKIETLLRKAFGTKNGAVRFTDYCEEHGVDVGFNAY